MKVKSQEQLSPRLTFIIIVSIIPIINEYLFPGGVGSKKSAREERPWVASLSQVSLPNVAWNTC